MNNAMKKLLILASATALAATMGWAAGLHLGMTGAVKSKVKELDDKVRQNVAVKKLTAIVSGTAAGGRPIAAAAVALRDCSGKMQTGTTAADGSFSLDVAELSFPLLLRVADGTSYYYSLADSVGTSNIHPLTDVILRSYFRSARDVTDVDSAYTANSFLVCAPSASAIVLIKSLVTDIVSPILIRNGVDPLVYDLFTTGFSANGTGFDGVLDDTQITADATFSTVTIRDISNNVVLSTITTVAGDFSVPAAPTDLSTMTVTSNTITLQWTLSSSTNVAGYAIYRDGTRVGAVPGSIYIDRNLNPGIQYSYAVEAFTWAGTRSAKTFPRQVTTLAYLVVSKLGIGSGTVTSVPAGVNCGSTCSANYTSGTQVTLTATPANGSTFTGWSGGGCSGTGNCILTLAASKSVTATFIIPTHTLTITKAGAASGTIASSPGAIDCGGNCSAAFPVNSQVILTPTPIGSSYLSGWTSGGCSGRETCTVTMDTDKTITATFSVFSVDININRGTVILPNKYSHWTAFGNSQGGAAAYPTSGWTVYGNSQGGAVAYPISGWTHFGNSQGGAVAYPSSGWTAYGNSQGGAVAHPTSGWTHFGNSQGGAAAYPTSGWTVYGNSQGGAVAHPTIGWTHFGNSQGGAVAYPASGWTAYGNSQGGAVAYPNDETDPLEIVVEPSCMALYLELRTRNSLSDLDLADFIISDHFGSANICGASKGEEE